MTRLGDVRHVRDDAIAPLHAQRAQPAGDRGDLVGELSPGELAQLAQLRRVTTATSSRSRAGAVVGPSSRFSA